MEPSKVLKVNFNDGNFDVLKNVLEYEMGRLFFFVAYRGKLGDCSLIYRRGAIETIELLDKNGTFKNVKLRRFNKIEAK